MNLTHVHLALNHVPVVLTVVGLALLGLAAVRRSGELRTVSLSVFVLSAVIAVGVYVTGEPAEDAVEGLPGVSHSVVERHEDAAGIALVAVLALGAVSVAAMGLGATRLGRRFPGTLVTVPLLLSVVAGGLMIWTASLGGQVRHTEIRGDVTSGAAGAGGHHDRD
jgi:hypothetical protein